MMPHPELERYTALDAAGFLPGVGEEAADFESRVAAIRDAHKQFEEELAEKCSVTPQAVSKWENDISAPDIALIPVLAKLFNVSCDELLGADPQSPKAVPPETLDLSKVILKITVHSSDGDNVKLNLPFMLAEPFLKSAKFGGSDALKSIDFSQVTQLIKSGAVGKLIEINSADGDIVEISAE